MSNNLSLNSNYSQNISSPEIQRKLQSEENFGALDKEKLKQDAVELKNKVKDSANENFIYRTLKNVFGVKDPKKAVKSFVLTVGAVIGFGVLGNKMSTPSAKLAEKLDDVLLSDKNIFGKAYSAVGKGFNFFKKGFSKIPKPKFVADIQDTLKNRKLNMEFGFFRGYERGAVGVFINTLNEILKSSILKGRDDILKNSLDTLKGLKVIDESLTSANTKNLLDAANKALKKAGADEAAEINKIINNLSDLQTKENSALKLFKELFGEKDNKAQELFNEILNGVDTSKSTEFYKKFTTGFIDHMRENPALKNLSNVEILELARKNELTKFGGPDVQSLIDVRMMSDSHGIANKIFSMMGDWWPVDIIEKLGKKIKRDPDFKFCRGNLFDSLIKFNAVNMSGTKTMPAKILQLAPTLIAEQNSNFVNDKSGFGIFLAYNLFSNFNDIQDAPKEKKASTAANSFITSAAQWLVGMPIAYKCVYGLASMKNLQGKGIISRLLRQAGKVFGLGLAKTQATTMLGRVLNKLKGVGGGALRFFLFMQVFSPMVSKAVETVSNKIFGKPYNKAEEEKQKQLEEQKNMVIPELGITQGQLIEKIQKNPAAMQKIQSDTKLLEQIKANPKALLDILDGKEPEAKPKTPANSSVSPVTKDLINKKRQIPQMQSNQDNTINNKTELFGKNKEEQKTTENIDNVTYIPSSEFSASTSTLSPEENAQYQSLMSRADKVLKNAEKYI